MIHKVNKNLYPIILDSVKKELEKEKSEFLEKTDTELYRLVIQNFRTASGTFSGLRLTDFGFEYASKFWEKWAFPIKLEEFVFAPSHIIWLERQSAAPYYYHFIIPRDRTFYTFCSHTAMILKLADGNLNNVVENPRLRPPVE